MAAGLSVGSMTMYLHYGKHVTGISGSAAHMSSTLASAVAHTPRMHRHTIVAADTAHHLVTNDCVWRRMHGGHVLMALVDRSHRRQPLPLCTQSIACSRGSEVEVVPQTVYGWSSIKAVKHILPLDVAQARQALRSAKHAVPAGASRYCLHLYLL
jgi:hypothetical protein